MRKAEVTRNTLETKIAVEVNLDGSGVCSLSTRIPLLEHMLDQVARHGLIDLIIKADGADNDDDDDHSDDDEDV